MPPAPPPANAWPSPASAPYPPGAVPYPPGAVPYPPGAVPYPPGAVPYPYAYPYPMPEKPQRTWYGWQTLVVLGISTGTIALSTLDRNGSVAAITVPIGLGGFLLGGPIVHWAHGKTVKGFISLGMNAGAVLVGAGVGASVSCAAGCSSSQGGFFVFFAAAVSSGIALVSANIVDVAVFAYDERPAQRPASVGGLPFTLAPTLDVRKDRASFGLMGTF